ncbi:MAG: hypothetical protein IKE58_04790 [Blautia sp.]|nr:hypothetical protein [Blautia sp.]
MAQIFSFDSARQKTGKARANQSTQIPSSSDSFYERVEYYEELLSRKEALMEGMASLAADLIAQIGMDKGEFRLNEGSARRFMAVDLEEELSLYQMCDGISFLKKQGHDSIWVNTRLNSTFHSETFEDLEMSSVVVRRTWEENGMEKWFIMSREGWIEEPFNSEMMQDAVQGIFPE